MPPFGRRSVPGVARNVPKSPGWVTGCPLRSVNPCAAPHAGTYDPDTASRRGVRPPAAHGIQRILKRGGTVSRPASFRVRRACVAIAVLAVAGASLAALPSASAGRSTESTYVVLYHAGATTTGAQQAVESAGGTLVADYAAIGVVVARSSSSGFATAMGRTANVDSAVATGKYATKLEDTASDDKKVASAAATWGDSLSGLQWDMQQISVPAAHAINSGRRTVVVGDLDTGLDFTHPDLAPNYERPAAPTVPAERRNRLPSTTTGTGTARTPPAPSPPPPTAPASSGSRRTSRSRGSRPATTTGTSSRRW